MIKKIICTVIIICLLAGCTFQGKPPKKAQSPAVSATETTQESGVWVSFSELDALLSGDFKPQFETLLQNCKSINISELFIHVRPYGDAIYPSKIFPLRESSKKFEGDVLEYMIARAKDYGISVHAWINPYRIRTADSDITALPDGSPAKTWLTDDSPDNDINVSLSGGIYLNPAEDEVRKTVIDGIRELLENYDLAGIHFDDYFYPTTDTAFDGASYNAYLAENEKPLGLDDWRRSQVNLLISGCHAAVKNYGDDLIFSISPAAGIEKNYSSLYADVKKWMKDGSVDLIIPQLYFGFNYPQEEFRFDNLLEEWMALERKDNVEIMIGLAPYKINTDSPADTEEWRNNHTILKRQIELCRKSGTNGYVFFSSSSLFSENTVNLRSLEEIKNIL